MTLLVPAHPPLIHNTVGGLSVVYEWDKLGVVSLIDTEKLLDHRFTLPHKTYVSAHPPYCLSVLNMDIQKYVCKSNFLNF